MKKLDKKGLLLAATFLIAIVIASCGGSSPGPTPIPDVVPQLTHATGLLRDPKSRYGKPYWRPRAMYLAIKNQTIPDVYDSRLDGGKVAIKDQRNCGSCWAFGTTTVAEVNYQHQTGKPIPGPLAPQEIVSCETQYFGCQGGLFSGEFVAKYGLLLEEQYPYTESSSKCVKSKLSLTPAVKPKSFMYIGSPDRNPTYDEVTAAQYQYGGVAVSAGASGYWSSFHGGGVFNKCTGTPVNHEISAIAYNKTKKTLTIQNSWGESFGDHGYMEIPWGCDNLSEDAGYFIYEGTPCQPPKVHLPAQIVVNDGDDLTLAVKSEPSVTYTWMHVKTELGTGAVMTFLPSEDGDVSLIAKNQCGEAEIKTLVTIKK